VGGRECLRKFLPRCRQTTCLGKVGVCVCVCVCVWVWVWVCVGGADGRPETDRGLMSKLDTDSDRVRCGGRGGGIILGYLLGLFDASKVLGCGQVVLCCVARHWV